MSIPFIIGKPAAALKDAKWATSAGAAKAGADGERRTAAELNRVAKETAGPTVLHDVRIPLPNVSANIDHLIVSGSTLTVIDSKLWKPGFYWTAFGHSFRGHETFPHAAKGTIPMAVGALEQHAADAGLPVRLVNPWLVIWSSRKYPKMRLRFLKPNGAQAVTGERFTKKLPTILGTEPADPQLVALLLPLVADTKVTAEAISRVSQAPAEPQETEPLIQRVSSIPTPFDDEPALPDYLS